MQGNDRDGSNRDHCSQLMHFTSSSSKVLKRDNDPYTEASKMESRWPNLPDELLEQISKRIGLKEFFTIGAACTNFFRFYKHQKKLFMESQPPFVILKTPHAKKSCSFFCLSARQTFRVVLPYFWGKVYVGFSGGYMIMTRGSRLWLINPFTREQLHIPESPFLHYCISEHDQVIHASIMGSEDFVIVSISSLTSSLDVYHSRNSSRANFAFNGDPWKVMDIAVFKGRIYAITDKAEIGVLSLTSAKLTLLELKSSPSSDLDSVKLVGSDDHLLVVSFIPLKNLEVYKIDFSGMEWVKLDTLGDQALFLGKYRKGSALRNPSRWGYNSNCVYYIGYTPPVCYIYSMENRLVSSILVAAGDPAASKLCCIDWYHPHQFSSPNYVQDE
ncbi:F-box protein [Quillaja saponaria]|uniref:F-box protein n=2 Tax=Quillaja saponaria TaxID=32244 RepID=A0AAD7PMM7_QUISA|nr:F-box protein [Quillaja saponaria]